MCDQNAKATGPTPTELQRPLREPFHSTGSRRRRIWELPQQCHCPTIGVCLPLDTLRRLVNKALSERTLADDYEVHVGAVAECGYRNRLSELLQHELEQRYERAIQHFRQAKTVEQVVQCWKAAVAQGDVTGAFWAALTHPRCDAALQEVLCRDMHMLQHQAGASVRTDITRFNAMQEANTGLTRELGRLQERSARFIAEKSGEIERLGEQLLQARADGISKDSRLALMNADLCALKASIPEFESNQRLLRKIEQMALRQAELEGQLIEARQKLAAATKLNEALSLPSAPQAQSELTEAQPGSPCPELACLLKKNVLCVGGRSGNIANYREQIERIGGRFAHHDGGLESSQNVLDANLAAADLVICQTGCISHNAYWRVKDFCKRNGKRCVFVENPSTSSFARGLEQIAEQEAIDPLALQGNAAQREKDEAPKAPVP